jgi:hypothetical protein
MAIRPAYSHKSAVGLIFQPIAEMNSSKDFAFRRNRTTAAALPVTHADAENGGSVN